MHKNVLVLEGSSLADYIKRISLLPVLEETFAKLASGHVIQPPQTLALFPEHRGDFITYLGVLSHLNVFGAKLSPYIPLDSGALVTAWTMLMSMTTGRPLLICDASTLTCERTAGTSALAISKLARPQSSILAVIGAGALALAHIRHILPLRAWKQIRVYSPSLRKNQGKQDAITTLVPEVILCASAKKCVESADVIVLATSSPTSVIANEDIPQNALVTSISTNAPNAHEISPSMLPNMDVYCDYKETTPESAGEMVLAKIQGIWTKEEILGDLAHLCAHTCKLPTYDKPVFFRSIGLGIEDIAIAYAVYNQIEG